MKLIFLLILLVYVFTRLVSAGEIVEGIGVTTAESKSTACDRAMAMAKKEAVEFLGIKINTEVNILQSDKNGITSQSFDLKVKQQSNAVIKVLEKTVIVKFDETTNLITCEIKSRFEITLNHSPNKAARSLNQPSEIVQNRIRKVLTNADLLNKTGEFDSAIFQYKTILDLSTDPEMRRMALDGIVNASLGLRLASPGQPTVESPSLPVLPVPAILPNLEDSKLSVVKSNDISGVYRADIVYDDFLSKSSHGVPSNMTVFSASSGSQISGALKEKEHGLFTYYLLKGMSGNADTNKDKSIQLNELSKYVSKNVKDQAAINGREQTPELQGNKDRVLVQFN